jgi:hypothetical protein
MFFMNKFIFIACAFPLVLFGQEKVSNAELARKLDLILGKLGGLEERVTQLESSNTAVQQEVKRVAQSAAEAKSATENLNIPQNEEEKKSFFNRLRIGLESDADQNRGPWTKKETWNEMRKNLTRFQVRKLLGNPNTIKGDLNPRIDQVYHYIGDLNGDGEEERGRVNFFNDRVVSYTSPF